MHWTQIFLGIIAISTLATAIMQIVLIVSLLTLVRRGVRLMETLERRIEAIGDRVEATAAAVQSAIITPLRDGAALVAGIRSALAVLKHLKDTPEKE